MRRALAVAVLLALAPDAVPQAAAPTPPVVLPTPPDMPPMPAEQDQCLVRGAVWEREMEAARIAWKYFERNYQAKTGLVNAVDQYPSTTMWDLGSTLLGTLAARELRLIDARTFSVRVNTLLGTLVTLALFDGVAPNKAYDASTAAMTDYGNKPSERGIGVSALDLARLLSALDVLACLHPELSHAARSAAARWNYCAIVDEGQLHGFAVDPQQKTLRLQEGRYGYEQYAGKAFAALGFDTSVSSRYDNQFWASTVIEGVPIAYDVRDPKKLGAHNYVVTESYALDAIEFGIDAGNRALLENIYEVQRRRWERTGIVTASSEDNVDRPPYFVYTTIFSDGVPWAAITDKGEDQSALRSVSTKAALSLVSLFPQRPYSGLLLRTVEHASDPEKGWLSGVYERGGLNRAATANTNGIVLELALYRMLGALHPACARCGRGLAPLGLGLPAEQLRARCLPTAAPRAPQATAPPSLAPPGR